MGATNGKKIERFAALVRVSTEKQEKQGESLTTQRKGIERDVERLGGKIVGWYGGQEHATAGYERAEVDRLIADAGKDGFDAVMVSYADRWSRDNLKSKEGLEAFRRAGVRFYVGSSEMDLYDPQVKFLLGMHAEVGEFIASQQAKKTLESKIERAQKGWPVCGDWPFGRVWDKDKKVWSLHPKEHAIVQDVAKRLLQGEPLGKLAVEYGVAVSNLWKVLRFRCGDTWEQHFRSKSLNVNETVITPAPRLLDETTIRAIAKHLEAKRTFLHRPPAPRHSYLLSGRVFCAVCGYSMTGQNDPRAGLSYYCHHIAKRYKKSLCQCPIQPRPRVRADWLEREVVHHLFKMFGNPAQIERAVRSAVPDCDDLLRRRQAMEAKLEKLSKSRDSILSQIVKGTITDEQAERHLEKIKEDEGVLSEELYKTVEQLGNLPTEDDLRAYVEKVDDMIFLYDDQGNARAGGNDVGSFLAMGNGDKRKLIDAVFSKPLPNGSPAGVYVAPEEGPRFGPKGRTRPWRFTIKGQLEFESVVSTYKDVNNIKSGVPFSPCPPSVSTNI